MTAIASVDLAPVRHADRVVALMLRELAEKRASIAPAITEAMRQSKDGGERAQRRMAERIIRAGAFGVSLETGTRGRYEMFIQEVIGWNPHTDCVIGVGDLIPPKPWLVLMLSYVNRGREIHCKPVLFVTHHALSRAAQRFGLKTTGHMIVLMRKIWNAISDKMDGELSLEELLDAPRQGHRLKIGDGVSVVLQRHETRDALVAATFLIEEEIESEES